MLVDVLTGPHRGRYGGVASIGVRPTFGESAPNLEVHLFDFDGDLYGEELSVALVAFLRPELKFDGVEPLVAQMRARRGRGARAAGARGRGEAMIETERLILRRWQARDRAPFAALNADPEVMRTFPKPLGPRRERRAWSARLEDRWAADGIGFAVAERKADGAFLGMVGLARVRFALPVRRGAVEVGWRLARAHWGQGYATEAARGWLAHGFGAMGLDEIVAFTVPANPRSQAVMRAARDAARPGARLRASGAAGGPRAAAAPGLCARPGGVGAMIETERLLLRRWLPRDRAPFAAMNADPAVMDFPRPLTRAESDAEMASFVERWRADGFCFGGGRAAERRGVRRHGGAGALRDGRADLPLRRDRLAAAAGALGTGLRQRGGAGLDRPRLRGARAGGDRGLHRSEPRPVAGGDAAGRDAARPGAATSIIRTCRRGIRCGRTWSMPSVGTRGRPRARGRSDA